MAAKETRAFISLRFSFWVRVFLEGVLDAAVDAGCRCRYEDSRENAIGGVIAGLEHVAHTSENERDKWDQTIRECRECRLEDQPKHEQGRNDGSGVGDDLVVYVISFVDLTME
jgi:hypothetical protein